MEDGDRLKTSVPGCWFGLFSLLGDHRLHFVRRLNRGRKPKGRLGLGCNAAPRAITFATGHGDMQRISDAEADPLQVGRSAGYAESVLDDDTRGARVMPRASFTAAEISEEKVDEHWVLRFPAHQLQGLGTDWSNSIIMLQDKDDVRSSKLKYPRSSYSSRNLSGGKSAQFSEGKSTGSAKEVMEIFEINRELFAKIVQDPYVAIRKQFDDHQTLRRKAKLAKSRSFPVDDSMGVKYPKPSTLKHKQYEVWSSPKEGKRIVEPTSDPAKTPDRNGAEVSRRSVVNGWNQMILKHFKGFKRRIRRALKDGRKEKELSIKASSAADFSGDMIEEHQWRSSLMNGGQISESKRRSFKRTSSLHESADKYARLLESISSREVDLPNSRSVKLLNDVRSFANESSVKTFRRRLSLPENLSFLFTEASFGTVLSSMPLRNDRECSSVAEVGDKSKSDSIDADGNREKPLQVTESTTFLETVEEADEVSIADDSGDIYTDENHEDAAVNSAKGMEASLHERTEITALEERRHSVSCPENLPPEEEITLENETVYKDLDNPNPIRAVDNILRDFHPDEDDDPAFMYVLKVLMISGVFDNDLESWYSEDQPLNPKLFQEVNFLTKPDTGSTEKPLGDSDEHLWQLLFDLVNATLLEMYEQSASYFPEAFSFNQRVRSVPKGRHMLKEVWTRVNRSWGLRPELDRTLDDVMARDMAKGLDGWLNCQCDGECAALELEDLVFDDLLAEILNFFYI